ncbi:MAG TPA: cell division protein FtsX [Clostridiales bacterium]|nr:cell division protein FtsX [Clostridiales bacterium]
MRKFFYVKLAVNNIKKNSQAYIPYILTCIGTIIMFYNMCFLATAEGLGVVSDHGSLRFVMVLGAIVIGIFSVIFLFYTNSFLIKKRKKEFGLFNILGMEKKHIARIMLWETVIVTMVSLVTGIFGGILLSKLMILLLFKIIAIDVPFGFEVPREAVLITVALFAGIFILNLIYNRLSVRLSKPIELLKGSNVGEKEPKTKVLQTIIGLLCLGAGYYIALTTESPLEALTLFFVAVVLVMIGTYSLFTAGSVALLKILRKNKRYYYKPKNFISVSSMIYRMKQNATGLANICILSTAVIIMLSSTVSLYIGMEDVLRTRYPRNIIVSSVSVTEEKVEQFDKYINDTTDSMGIEQIDVMNYRSLTLMASQTQNTFKISTDASGISGSTLLFFISVDDYNRLSNTNYTLEEDEALLYEFRAIVPGDVLDFNGLELRIKKRIPSFDLDGYMSAMLVNSCYVVVKDIPTISTIQKALEQEKQMQQLLSYFYGFDVQEDRDVQMSLTTQLRSNLNKEELQCSVDGMEISRASFYSLYGGLFYLGIFLGLLFIMATVLIIYYKQIAEGYDDKERFEIMQKVGMSRDEVKKSIKNQVIKVFFLPLVTAVIHIAFAFKVITKLLTVLNLTNVPLFAVCTLATILVFAAFYTLVYSLTAKVYYRIVS